LNKKNKSYPQIRIRENIRHEITVYWLRGDIEIWAIATLPQGRTTAIKLTMTLQPQRLHAISKLRNIVFRCQRLNEINTVAQMPTLQELLHSQTDEEKICEDNHTINCWTQLHRPNRETMKENKNKICRRNPRLLLKGGGPYKTPE
jgi:hypothetical protein